MFLKSFHWFDDLYFSTALTGTINLLLAFTCHWNASFATSMLSGLSSTHSINFKLVGYCYLWKQYNKKS